jgi:hypothetical protein
MAKTPGERKKTERYVGLVSTVSDGLVRAVLRGANDLPRSIELEAIKIRSIWPIKRYDILVLEVNNEDNTFYIAYPHSSYKDLSKE